MTEPERFHKEARYALLLEQSILSAEDWAELDRLARELDRAESGSDG